jgi:hypothetical protein
MTGWLVKVTPSVCLGVLMAQLHLLKNNFRYSTDVYTFFIPDFVCSTMMVAL